MSPSIDPVTADLLTASILSRRAGKPGAVQFRQVTDLAGNTAHVVSDQLLLRTADYQAGAAALAGWPTDSHLDGRLTRVFLPPGQQDKLPGLLDGIAIPGVHPNAVVPTGGAGDPTIVWKRVTPPVPVPAPAAAKPPAGAGAPARVAIIDTGVPLKGRTDGWLAGLLHPNHDNLDPLTRFSPTGFLDLAAGHGTFVAGVVQRLAPDAALDVLRAVDSDGIGTDLDIANQLWAAARAGAQIINLSVGAETYGNRPPPALAIALELIQAAGLEVLIVASAGNSGQDREVWPAAFPQVTAVAARSKAGPPAVWSSFGPWVDCAALGEDVLSTYVLGTQDAGIVTKVGVFSQPWARWTGTSFAAPSVVGRVAALMQSKGLTAQSAFKELVAGTSTEPGYGNLL